MGSKEISKGIDKDIRLNIMLLGDPEVGKTSIINRYIGKGFFESYLLTVFDNFCKKITSETGEQITLIIIDTGGKKEFKSIINPYKRKQNGFIFVYDITNKKSFEELKNYVNDIQYNVGNFKSVILGNKSDLKINEEVTEEEGRKFADEIGANFYLVSAKDNINIEEGFKSLIDQIPLNEILKKQNEIYLRKEESTRRDPYCNCTSPTDNYGNYYSYKKRKLSKCERCLNCCGYYCCKECLKGCTCEELSESECKLCCIVLGCLPCACCFCCKLGIENKCCCCQCPKEGRVEIYGEK